MTRRRWIADEVSGNRAALIGAHADHLARVLRVRVGQQFDIATGEAVRVGVVSAVSNSRVEFDLGKISANEWSLEATLVLAVFKFDRMEWAIEKCTELGVTRIIPLVSQRTESHLAAAAYKRVERWERIARQASEQSRRSNSPEISEPVKLKEVLEISTGNRIVLSEAEQDLGLKDAFRPPEPVTLAIGPEGGWTPGELDSFRDAGWAPVSLGKTILRAETAAVAALAIISSELW